MLKLEDKLHFGKYKGKTVAQVMVTDPTYLTWLRGEKRKEGKNAFTEETDAQLASSLKGKHHWPKRIDPKGAPVTAEVLNQLDEARKSEEERLNKELEERQQKYSHQWGEW